MPSSAINKAGDFFASIQMKVRFDVQPTLVLPGQNPLGKAADLNRLLV
jgi:hypothetical protein